MYIQNTKLQREMFNIWSGFLRQVMKPLGFKNYYDLDVIKQGNLEDICTFSL